MALTFGSILVLALLKAYGGLIVLRLHLSITSALMMHCLNCGLAVNLGATMQHETIKDYATVIVVAIVGALVLLHSLDALFV